METVTLQREPFTETHTYGSLSWDNLKLCDTLELPWDNNNHGTSCIPPGTYQAIQFCSPHNGDVWLLENTAPRSMIELHSANVASQLEGCIAVGTKGMLGDVPAVLRSKDALAKLKKTLPTKFIIVILNSTQGD